MLKYVDICVDMKAGRKCKDALINYRNACQQVCWAARLHFGGEGVLPYAARCQPLSAGLQAAIVQRTGQ